MKPSTKITICLCLLLFTAHKTTQSRIVNCKEVLEKLIEIHKDTELVVALFKTNYRIAQSPIYRDSILKKYPYQFIEYFNSAEGKACTCRPITDLLQTDDTDRQILLVD